MPTKFGSSKISEKKSEENLLKAVEHYEKSHDRASLGKVLPLAEEFISALKAECESKICKIDLSKIIYRLPSQVKRNN
jgi:DNA polymerase (family 10)